MTEAMKFITSHKIRNMIGTLTVLLVGGFLLFFRLGYYYLWDDESINALFAKSLWTTGDLYAKIGQNIIAFNSGVELQNFYNRFLPPLQFYVTAPFVGTFGNSTFAVRFPFALCGLLTIILVFFWMNKAHASGRLRILLSLGILGNVSFFLFFRQSRYYALSIILSTFLVYLYSFRNNSWKNTLFLIITAILLFASNFLCGIATFACLIADYFIFDKNNHKFHLHNLFLIAFFVICGCLFLLMKYNAAILHNTNTNQHFFTSFAKRFHIFLWNLRELNTCEFGSGLILLISPFLYFFTKKKIFLRCSLAILLYCAFIAMFSPQLNTQLEIAVVRYTVPLILLCILTVALAIDALAGKSLIIALGLAFLAFGTNVLNGGPLSGSDQKNFERSGFRSTMFSFISELLNPVPDPYKIVTRWIQQNIPENSSLWVSPGYANYPLMFYAPQYLYAWQLDESLPTSPKNLDAIHYFGKDSPEYMIAFGPYKVEIENALTVLEKKGIKYIQVGQIDVYWKELIRPELYWHSFKEVTQYSKEYHGLYFYKRE